MHDLPTSELLVGYELALEFLEDSLVSLRALLTAYRGAQPLPDSALLKRYEHALQILDDSLVSLRALVGAHRAGQRIPEKALRHLRDQCSAAAAATKKLRGNVARSKAKDSRRLTRRGS